MTEEQSDKIVGMSAEKVAVIIGLIAQIAMIVWMAAVLYSSVNYNTSELEEINSKLTHELNDLKVRLRAAEKEITIMDKIIELELRKSKP